MKETSFKQKLFLVLCSVLFTIILLEVSLRIAGLLVLGLQERHNHLSFNKNEYRILCLGESTTALGGEDSYPSQLERMLNVARPQKKFSVINKGIISTTSNYILTHVQENLDLYKPQLVIVMMGINDRAYLHDLYKNLWWENLKSYLKEFRVYKLGHLLFEHITHRINDTNAPFQEIESSNDDGNYQRLENFLEGLIAQGIKRFHDHISASVEYQSHHQLDQARIESDFAKQSAITTSSVCVELARRFRLQGLYEEAQDILLKAAIFNVNYKDIYHEWGELYLAQGKSAQAINAFQLALSLDPKNTDDLLGLARAFNQAHNDNAFVVYAGYLQLKPNDYWGYIELSRWLKMSKHFSFAKSYLSQAIIIGPFFDQAYVDLGEILDDQGEYKQEEAFYLKVISDHPKMNRLYQILGQFYEKNGKENLAKEYFKKRAQLEMGEYTQATFVNYSLLLDKILSRHIKVIVMQYPVRDIGFLKDYLGNREGVIFVENKQNFKQALSKADFSHYFKDNFAYDFGHCTRAGNELIARNLTQVILNNE